MIILAFDCSSSMSIALMKNGKIIDEKYFPQNSSHSEKLVLELKNIINSHNLTFKEIDLFVANNGPGGYTGIRVALAVLKMLKITFDKPCLTLNSFEILSYKYRQQKSNLQVAISGNINEIFFTKYRFINNNFVEETAQLLTDYQAINQQLKLDDFICGSANKLFVEHQNKSNEDDNNLVGEMTNLALEIFKNQPKRCNQEILPLYLREPKTTAKK